MTQSLLAKLDELQTKVFTLAKTLEQSRHDNKNARQHIEKLTQKNAQLEEKLTHVQKQVDEMMNQWFPEFEPKAEK